MPDTHLGNQPLEMFDTILNGTRRALQCAGQSGAKWFLFLSSGAAYGPQPAATTHIPETYGGGPDPLPPDSEYCEIDTIGIRPGEKLHEVLLSEDEARHSLELGDRFVITPVHPWWKGQSVPEDVRCRWDFAMQAIPKQSGWIFHNCRPLLAKSRGLR